MEEKRNTDQTVMEVDGIGYLSLELITDVLSRLPAKVVCKFRCVSKQWLNLISNPYFINLHRDRSQRNPLLLFSKIQHEGISSTLHLTTMDMKGMVHTESKVVVQNDIVYQSFPCSGLILLEASHCIYLCNPSIGQLVGMIDAARSPGWVPYYGFGFLPSTNEYKILRLLYPDVDTDDDGDDDDDDADYDDIEISCDIYPVRNGGLMRPRRSLEVIWPSKVWVTYPSVCVNGVVYWMIKYINVERDEVLKIISLDLEKEECGTVVDPLGYLGPYQDSKTLHLAELKGFLCLSINSSKTSTMDIWVLKNHKNSIWKKEYTIDFSALCGFGLSSYYISPVDIRNGEILMLLEFSGSLHYYNIANKSFKTAEGSETQKDVIPFIFFESFFSLGTILRWLDEAGRSAQEIERQLEEIQRRFEELKRRFQEFKRRALVAVHRADRANDSWVQEASRLTQEAERLMQESEIMAKEQEILAKEAKRLAQEVRMMGDGMRP